MAEKINESGYRRARELMEAGGNRDLTPMIKAAANQETEWLEVKANPFMPAKDDPYYKEGENADCYEWTNLVKPLIALANFHGGVLLLGIEEDKGDGGKFKAVPLKNRNHEVVDGAGFDGFKNELAACFGKSKFEFKDVVKGKDMTYEMTRPLGDLISYEPHKAFYGGQLVLAIFVRVSDQGVTVLESSCDRHAELVLHPDKKGNNIYPTVEKAMRTIYLVRCPGEQGRVETKVFESDAELNSYRNRNVGAACKDNIKNYYGAIALKDADTLVGRVDECKEVSKILDEGKYPLITGGAGIGKTSVATKLAQKWVGGCALGCVVVKVDAEKMEKLEEAFSSGDFRRLIASQTEGFQWQNRNDATEVCKDVLAWLKLYGIKCLVLYDNIEDVRLLAPSETSRFSGYDGSELVSLCFVSRHHGKRRDTGMIEPYELPDLSEEDAMLLLKQRNPFQNADEESAALEIVRLPEVAGYRAWVLDIISARMTFDEVPSYRYMLKQLKRDLSSTIGDAGENGEVMTPSVREGKATILKLLEPSLTIFDDGKKSESLNLLLLSLFLPPDRFAGDEIFELYRCVFGVSPEIDEEDLPHRFAEMKRPMMDLHLWLKSDDGFKMHRLTAEGVRSKYRKELSEVWTRISAYLEKYVTAKIDLRRIPTVLSILSAAAGMGFADDVKRLCLNTENLEDSHFLSRAIEFCIDNCDLRVLIDTFRSEGSVAAIYMCAQYDVARKLSKLRSVVDALMSIVDEKRPDDATDASTWHYVALAYLLLGDMFSDMLSKNCAFGCYCNALEIMHRRLCWDSHPDVLRAVNRLYDVGRGCHEWNDEVTQRVLELNEKPGASLDLAFRCRMEGDYEYAMLSDSGELHLQAQVAEMDGEDGSTAVQAFVKARLNIALRWYRKCAEVLSEVGVGATPCFLIECYMAEFYDHANSVLRDYGGSDDLRQESERRLVEIVEKYDLVNTDEFKDFCRGDEVDNENCCGNIKFLCSRLLQYVQGVRDGSCSDSPDALDRLFDRLSVNSGDVANSYVYVAKNYHRVGRTFLSTHTFDESVDLTEMREIAQRFLFLLTRFLKERDFECPAVCEFLRISGPEFRDAYHAIRPMNADKECFLDSLIESCGVKGRMEDAVGLLEGRMRLWESRGLDDYWRRDMETLGEMYYSRQNYKASLQIYDAINRRIGRESRNPGYAYERCRCYEFMNDSESVWRMFQESQGGMGYQTLAAMAEQCRKYGLPRFEWYVKRMIELSSSKIEAFQASLRAAGGFVVRNEKTGEEGESDDVVCLYKELKSRAKLYEKIGEEALGAKDNADAEKLAKEVSERLPGRFMIWMVDGL